MTGGALRPAARRAVILGFAAAALAAPAGAAAMTLTSPDVRNGGTMPMAQVCAPYGGGNRSPALVWSGAPAGTRSFAVTMHDPDAPTPGGFWHWTVFDIPARVHRLAAGAGGTGSGTLPEGAVEGRNDARQNAYLGACPPPGDRPHRYEITVYALKVARLPLTAASSGAAVGAALRGTVLAEARIVATFAEPR